MAEPASFSVKALYSCFVVKGFHLSYHYKETILLAIDPHYGNLNWEFPKIWGTLFWGPYNKSPAI